MPDPIVRLGDESHTMTEREYHLFTKVAGRVAAAHLSRLAMDERNPQARDIETIKRVRSESHQAARRAMRRAVVAREKGDEAEYRKVIEHLAALAERFRPGTMAE
jgi:hypothetical protein